MNKAMSSAGEQRNQPKSGSSHHTADLLDVGKLDGFDVVVQRVVLVAGIDDKQPGELQVVQGRAHGLGGARRIPELELEAEPFPIAQHGQVEFGAERLQQEFDAAALGCFAEGFVTGSQREFPSHREFQKHACQLHDQGSTTSKPRT